MHKQTASLDDVVNVVRFISSAISMASRTKWFFKQGVAAMVAAALLYPSMAKATLMIMQTHVSTHSDTLHPKPLQPQAEYDLTLGKLGLQHTVAPIVRA